MKKMLIDRDVKGAEEYTKQVIAELLQNKVDLSQLVITKALAKAGTRINMSWSEKILTDSLNLFLNLILIL